MLGLGLLNLLMGMQQQQQPNDPWAGLRNVGDRRPQAGGGGSLLEMLMGGAMRNNRAAMPLRNMGQAMALDNPVAARSNSKSYTLNGTMLPKVAMNGKPRNTYADRGGSLVG